MPLGSSSAAPVMRPGPRRPANSLIFLAFMSFSPGKRTPAPAATTGATGTRRGSAHDGVEADLPGEKRKGPQPLVWNAGSPDGYKGVAFSVRGRRFRRGFRSTK